MSASISELTRQMPVNEHAERLACLLRSAPNYRRAVEISTSPQLFQAVEKLVKLEELKS